jgi:hypothetical protein
VSYDSFVRRGVWIGVALAAAVVACQSASPAGPDSGAPEKAGEFKGIATASSTTTRPGPSPQAVYADAGPIQYKNEIPY